MATILLMGPEARRRCRTSGSAEWAREQVAVVGERVGAGNRLGGAARAAGEGPEVQIIELLAGRDRCQLSRRVGTASAGAVRVGVAWRAVVEDVGLGRGDPRVVAVGVVERRDLGELGEEAHQVRHVWPGELHQGLGRVQPLDRLRKVAVPRGALDPRQLAQRVGHVVVLPRAG